MPTQTGIFNVLDYGLGPDKTPTQNTQKLQNLVDMLLNPGGPTAGCGGTIEFPMIETGGAIGTYQFNDSITIGEISSPVTTQTGPAAIRFIGTCPGSFLEYSPPVNSFYPLLQMTEAKDLFIVDNHGDAANDDLPGVLFEDLSIAFDDTLTDGAAIKVTGGSQNVHISRIAFWNCPHAVSFFKALKCSMSDCSGVFAPNVQACVKIGDYPTQATEIYIANCRFLANSSAAGMGIGFLILNSEHIRMMNVRIEGFQYGLLFEPEGRSFRGHFTNVTVRQHTPLDSPPLDGGGLVIRPQTSPSGNGSVTETVFVACEFAPTDNGGTAYEGAGIIVDSTSGTIDVLRFVSCTSLNWNGPGLQIIAGEHIEIQGGEFSANGQYVDALQCGIAVGVRGAAEGAVQNVRIVGASCLGTVLGLPANQKYGIYVTDGAQNVLISSCDLTGNVDFGCFIGKLTGTAPTKVFIRDCNASGYTGPGFAFSSPGTLEILNCAGYNDLGTSYTALPTGTFSNITFGYYGPLACYVWPGVGTATITIQGHTTSLSQGTIILAPGQNAKVTGSPLFLAVGF